MTELNLSLVDTSHWLTADAFIVGAHGVDEAKSVQVRWLPIALVKVTGGRADLGVTADGDWVLASEQKTLLYSARFGSRWGYVVGLLEWTPEVIRGRCRASAETYGLDPDQVWAALPWIEVVRAALEWSAPQWVGPALDWVELLNCGSELQPELARLLSSDRVPRRLTDRADEFLNSR